MTELRAEGGSAGTGAKLLAPVVFLILISLIGWAVAISSLVDQANRNAATNMRVMVAGALSRERQGIASLARENGRWDDAVVALYDHVDEHWAATNLAQPEPLHIYVIDDKGETLWSLSPRGRRDVPLATAAAAALPSLLAHLPRDLATARHMRTGQSMVVRMNGKPAVLGVMPVVPLNDQRLMPSDRLRFVVMARDLDHHVLDAWRDAFQLTGIGWHRGADGDAANRLDVRDVTGASVGALAWPPIRAGWDALKDMAPLLIGVGVIFMAVMAWLVNLVVQARRQLTEHSEDMAASAREARRLADTAELSRREVEVALAEAESARRELGDIAERERLEQARHEVQLRQTSLRIAAELRRSLAALVDQLNGSAEALELSAGSALAQIAGQQARAEAIRLRSQDATDAARSIAESLGGLSQAIGEISSATEGVQGAARAASDESSRARETSDTLLHNVTSIGEAASLIARVSGRTNLLALNATIEAARAGDAGRGFAVVAQEVKALAHQTGQTTDAIKQKINGVAAAARSTVDLVEAVDGIVAGLIQRVSASSEAIHRQREAVEAIRENASGVAENARTSDEAVTEISASLDSVAATAASTREIGLAVRQNVQALQASFVRLVSELEAA